jgi:hypothetical protein
MRFSRTKRPFPRESIAEMSNIGVQAPERGYSHEAPFETENEDIGLAPISGALKPNDQNLILALIRSTEYGVTLSTHGVGDLCNVIQEEIFHICEVILSECLPFVTERSLN